MQRFVVVDASGNSATMARIERLEDNRVPDLIDDLHCSLDRARDIAFGDGQSNVAQHSLGVVLVLRDLDSNSARVVGERRLNAAEIFSESQLYQRVIIQSSHWYSATFRLFDQGGCRWTESNCFIERQQLLDDCGDIVRAIGDADTYDFHRVSTAP